MINSFLLSLYPIHVLKCRNVPLVHLFNSSITVAWCCSTSLLRIMYSLLYSSNRFCSTLSSSICSVYERTKILRRINRINISCIRRKSAIHVTAAYAITVFHFSDLDDSLKKVRDFRLCCLLWLVYLTVVS